MKAHLDVEKVIQELTENTQAAAWVNLEPEDPPTLLNQWLTDLKNHSGRIPVRGPIVIREREVTDESP